MRSCPSCEHEQVISLNTENQTLKAYVKTLTDEVAKVTSENKTMVEIILDVQAHSMRDNLVDSGIPEQAKEDLEETAQELITKQLKFSADTVKTIIFHRVHYIGSKKNWTANAQDP